MLHSTSNARVQVRKRNIKCLKRTCKANDILSCKAVNFDKAVPTAEGEAVIGPDLVKTHKIKSLVSKFPCKVEARKYETN